MGNFRALSSFGVTSQSHNGKSGTREYRERNGTWFIDIFAASNLEDCSDLVLVSILGMGLIT